MKKRFDSDTAALLQRVSINKGALFDLEEWIFKQIILNPDMQVLDLGCGTGKQIFALHKLLSTKSQIIGIDVSADAVREVNKLIKKEGITNVKALECLLDKVIDYFKKKRFDLILSTYAIYYSNNMLKLLSSLPCLLNKNGQIFICGPGKGTNQEFYNLINELPIDNSLKIKPINDFISEEDIIKIASNYDSYRIVRLENKVIFSSPENIFSWWENHNSYILDIRQEIQKSLDEYFKKNHFFLLSKNVLGVKYESN